MRSLCAPVPEVSCFACCPPIRPPHYDHLDHVGSLRREFAENRRRFLDEGPSFSPIVGYYCWALGFLDAQGRKIGCMLHPGMNNGTDLRFLIDYGKKCLRESCSAARIFALLPSEGQDFWLPLAQGMNSFYYSSPKSNPLFHLLLWGPIVLESLRSTAHKMRWTATDLCSEYPFLLDLSWQPKAHRYLFRLGLELVGPGKIIHNSLARYSRRLLDSILILKEVKQNNMTSSAMVHTHLLPLQNDFSDFLRLGLGWSKTSLEQAYEIESIIQRLAREIARED
jgi:hypothetical protein